MSFLSVKDESDLLRLIETEHQENLFLDYKNPDSIGKADGKKNELSRDISSFANSAGGQIIYGIQESNHLPRGIIGCDISKRDWLNQVINSRIYPRISGIRIHPISLQSGKYCFVVTIPESHTAHQAHDRKYWKRTEFERVEMFDHEIKQTINRGQEPVLIIEAPEKHSSYERTIAQQRLHLTLINNGKVTAKAPVIFVHIPTDLNPAFQGKWREIKSGSKLIQYCTKYWLEWDNIMDIPLHPHFPMNISGNESDALAIKYLPGVHDNFALNGYYEIYAENMMPKFGILRFSISRRGITLYINEIEALPNS